LAWWRTAPRVCHSGALGGNQRDGFHAEKPPPLLRAALSGATIYEQLMPRDGAIVFGDLIGKLDVLHVGCAKCERAGRYQVQRLIEERGRDGKIIDWLDQITADCPKKAAARICRGCFNPKSLSVHPFGTPSEPMAEPAAARRNV
jgi:hypothetical protein